MLLAQYSYFPISLNHAQATKFSPYEPFRSRSSKQSLLTRRGDMADYVGDTQERYCQSCKRTTDQLYCRDEAGGGTYKYYWRCDECGGESSVRRGHHQE
jgi:hypothetical protein